MTYLNCSKCNFYFDRHAPENCPKCGHDKFHREIVESDTFKGDDSLTVKIISRKESIVKKPFHFFIGLILIFVGFGIMQIEHPIAFLLVLISEMLGVAMMPINQKREEFPLTI